MIITGLLSAMLSRIVFERLSLSLLRSLESLRCLFIRKIHDVTRSLSLSRSLSVSVYLFALLSYYMQSARTII